MRKENVSKENVTQVSGKLQKSVIEVQQKYGDILNLPHHVSEALTGYKEAIEETERLAEKKIEREYE